MSTRLVSVGWDWQSPDETRHPDSKISCSGCEGAADYVQDLRGLPFIPEDA